MRRIIRLSLLNFIVVWMSAGLFAAGDTLVSFRLYEGFRGDAVSKPSVVTSYYLKPLFVGNIVSAAGMDREKNELKRIFNLKNLKLMTGTHWGWKENQKGKRVEVIVLNGHEFKVELDLLQKRDSFKVKVIEKSKSAYKGLMETEIVLPEQKTAVFGFEDSMNKPYFLSFHREQDEAVILEEPLPIAFEDRPRVIKRVTPVYPVVALKAGIQGKVIVEVTIDTVGRVFQLRIIKGNPLLRLATLKALKQWEYEPYKVNGEARPVVFTIAVLFSHHEGKKVITEQDPDMKVSKASGSSIPDIWPTRGYLTSPFGFRVHPVTGKRAFHNGIDIAAKLGTKVVAAADGVVIAAEYREYHGNLVIIDHKNGYTTWYAKLDSFKVKKGDKVKKMQVIGFVGSSGQSSAPHLHWEVRLHDKPINPTSLIDD